MNWFSIIVWKRPIFKTIIYELIYLNIFDEFLSIAIIIVIETRNYPNLGQPLWVGYRFLLIGP